MGPLDPSRLGAFLMRQIPPSDGEVVERGNVLPLGTYRTPDGRETTTLAFPQPMREGLDALAYALGYRQDPNAPAGYVTHDALNKGGQGLAESAMVGSLGARAPTGALRAGGGRRARLDKSPQARLARALEQGYSEDVWYHGANRADRIADAGKFDPRRATSGPMAFFTDDPNIASSYAKGKSDTSMPDYDNVSAWFTADPKELGIGGRTPVEIERSWHFLTPEQRATITDRARRVGYQNRDEADGPFTLHPEGVNGSITSNDHFDYIMRENRGNPLAALRELWLEGGDLHGREGDLAEIYRLAGYPAKVSDKTAPWFEAPGVIPTRIKMARPLQTDNADELRDKVLPALESAFARDRSRKKEFGADAWDKNTRYTPKEWVQQLKQDIESGQNSFVWTSIPDKVTNELRKLGYDGIIDMGGKMGGEGHRVAIPFSPQQVRSTNAMFDPSKSDSANLLAANPMAGAIPLAFPAPQEDRNQALARFLASGGA